MSDELEYKGKPVSKMKKAELIEALKVAVRMLEDQRETYERYRKAITRWGINPENKTDPK